MRSIARHLAERVERWHNGRFRAQTRRMLARQATATLHGGAQDPALDKLEMRLWTRIDAQIKGDATGTWRKQMRGTGPRLRVRVGRGLTLALPALAAAVLVFAFLSVPKAQRVPSNANIKGVENGDPPYAPAVESLRVAVVNAHGDVIHRKEGMRVRVGDSLVFEADVRGLDRERGFAVDLSYAVDAGDEVSIVANFPLKNARQPFVTAAGYVAFRPTRPGDYTFRLRATRSPGKAQQMRVHVEDSP